MNFKRLERLEQKIHEQKLREKNENQSICTKLLVDFIQSNKEAYFYFVTIWRWSVGSMNEQLMERHNCIHSDTSSEEFVRGERFHQATGLGNEYRYRIDYPEVLKSKFFRMFLDWVEQTGKAKTSC